MKKRSFLFAAAVSTVFAVISGCKSVPAVTNSVDPLLLLDNNSSFYLRIPAGVDENLISRVMSGAVKGLRENEARLIAERIDVVYAGLNRTRRKTDYQLSASCAFPKAAVSKAFSKKNGWERDSLFLNDDSGAPAEYIVYRSGELCVSVPDSQTACAGRNVSGMVETYHTLYYRLPGAEHSLDEHIASWLFYDQELPDNRIKYYASKPQSFLTMLTGAALNFNLVYVRGEIAADTKRDDQFIMDFEFEFRDRRFVPAARGSLSVAFGLTDSDVFLETPTHLVVRNIKISKEQFYSILVL